LVAMKRRQQRVTDEGGAGRPVLLVASTGGHLEELISLRPALVSAHQRVAWVSFDSPQSRSLLVGEPDVTYVRRIGSRDYGALARCVPTAVKLLLHLRPRAVYSTGAGIALAFLPFAWLVAARATYIESAARTSGPSATGRVLFLFPWIRLRTQYRNWATRRWRCGRSVFDGYHVVPCAGPTRRIGRVVVTLGTQEGFPFVSLVRSVQRIVPGEVEIKWQVGPDLPVNARPTGARDVISSAELSTWLGSADAVIAHAGVGSALHILRQGRVPVLVPRSARRGEHVDDHQALIAAELERRGLAIVATPDTLAWSHIQAATGLAVRR
jgi:UDP-N-acetylglucosamine--N-acetylmuramyl-(pentapeptide) pyrophosphoryl-undecaprenol N-acetylglucosamine transferase